MAAFTSKAAGAWATSGQVVWNEPGIPGDGDTVNITHVIAITSSVVIGTGAAINAITFSGDLTVAAAVSLTVKGNVLQGNAPFTLNQNSGLIFDCTAANR